MSFDFTGSAEERRETYDDENGAEQIDRSALNYNRKSKLISRLNERSDEIAQDIQREVGRILRPIWGGSITVQAEVRFLEGSLVIEGTVIAMAVGALGSIGAQAAQQALAGTLSKLLETSIQRVAQRWLRQAGPDAARFEPFKVNGQMHTIQQVNTQPTAQENTQNASREAGESSATWLFPAIAVTTFVNTVLLAVLLTIQIMQSG